MNVEKICLKCDEKLQKRMYIPPRFPSQLHALNHGAVGKPNVQVCCPRDIPQEFRQGCIKSHKSPPPTPLKGKEKRGENIGK